ncbi:ROK family protein [Thioalkalivibrio sp.]|uniref:glucokinase n=1 Tax=Thioalkalivibrio sp. TaxID=2093813 RepID=UPI0012D5FC2A|nr:ROK family protein [Thioalkalivibrio sp.]TVP82696.1 MAG: ROK family protein [Thioalkalivibrio sp.]
MSFLVADIGGTKTLLALAQPGPEGWRFEHKTRLTSSDFPSAGDLIRHWLQTAMPEGRPLDGIGLALAGPVKSIDGSVRAKATNLDWPVMDEGELGRELGAPTLLINDFAAIGASLDALEPDDTVTLQPGAAESAGLRLVVGAGTGLGTCAVGPPPRSQLFAGEGGHADFAPADDWQAALAQWVRGQEGRCSREHLLSGPGIARIAAYLQQQSSDTGLAQALQEADPAAAIGALAAQRHAGALQVAERFVSIYGGQLGDLALSALPRGGVFIAGGIAPRWLQHFQTPGFLRSFRNKAPMQKLLEELPLHLIVHSEPGLLGAAVAVHRAVETVGENA